MKPDEQKEIMPNNKNLEKIIDELCKNLDYAWRYYFTLEALQNDLGVKQRISDYKTFLNNNTDLKRIKDWRDKVVAHLSNEVFLRDSDFFESNKLHLCKIREILEFFEQVIKKHGSHFLVRFDYTRSTNVKKVTDRLFKRLRCVS